MLLQLVAVLHQILTRFDFFEIGIGPGVNLRLLQLNSFLPHVCSCLQLLLLSEQAPDVADVVLLNFGLVQPLEVFLTAGVLCLVDLRQRLVVFLDLGSEFLGSVPHFALLVALGF